MKREIPDIVKKRFNTLVTYFDRIQFEEVEHKYTVDGKNMIPVSNCIKELCIPFNEKAILKASSIAENRSEAEIKARWDSIKDPAIARGNDVHNFGEDYVLNKVSSFDAYDNIQKQGVLDFLESLPSNIYYLTPEIKMFSVQYGIAGTADLPLYDIDTDSWIIADWKTNRDLYKKYKFQYLKPPFDKLLDMAINKYQVQLNFYQYLIQQIEDFRVSERWIVWLKTNKQTGEKFRMFEANDYQDKIHYWLENIKQ